MIFIVEIVDINQGADEVEKTQSDAQNDMSPAGHSITAAHDCSYQNVSGLGIETLEGRGGSDAS